MKIDSYLIFLGSSRGGLVVERLLHKKCHSATVDQIPSKNGASIVQKWKHFFAIPIAGRRAALAVYDTCLRLKADNNTSLKTHNNTTTPCTDPCMAQLARQPQPQSDPT